MGEPRTGATVMAGPVKTTFEVTAAQVDGNYCIVRQTIPAGSLFWPHCHTHEDQVVVVLSGTLGVRVGDHEWEAPTGSVVHRPKGVPHTVWNSTVADVEILEITSPGRFDEYFAEMGEITAAGGDSDRRAALLQRFEVEGVEEWIDDLRQRHQVV